MRIGRLLVSQLAFLLVLTGASALAQAQSGADKRTLIVLDASGSMNQRLPGGQTRIEAARAAVIDTIDRLAPDTHVALRVYGHQSTPDKRNCDDTQLVAPFAPVGTQKERLRQTISGIQALGYTPIAKTLERAAEDFKSAAPGGQRTIILVSDGRETCKADPCALAAALARADATLSIHTIGFGVDAAARTQLQCIARVARGTYSDANSREELNNRIAAAAAEAPKPAPPAPPPPPKPVLGKIHIPGLKENSVYAKEAETGKEYPFGIYSDMPIEVPPGNYALKLLNGLWSGIEVKAGETTVVTPAFLDIAHGEGQYLMFDLETSEQVASLIAVKNLGARFALVPGRYRFKTTKGFEWPGDIEIKPGVVNVLKASQIRFKEADLPQGEVLTVKLSSPSHTYEQGFDVNNRFIALPAGRYTISYPKGPTVPPQEIDLKEASILELARPAWGTLKIAGDGQFNISINEATTKAWVSGLFYLERRTISLFAGRYVIEQGGRRVEVEIRPGQITEIPAP